MQKLLCIYKRYKSIFDNIFFVGLVQVFGLIAPLITYPYLVGVLGRDIYGTVLTAQMLISYATIVIDFGSNSVCAKNVAIHHNDKEKLSEILSAVMTLRFKLWILCFFIYMIVVWFIPSYQKYALLFAVTYLMTLNEFLFPQFYFQGVEKMKIVSLLSILIKLIFIALIFIFINDKSHYMLVPVFYTIGYATAGLLSLYILFKSEGLHFVRTGWKKQKQYFRECLPILSTDLICTIKDKFNYMLVGLYIGMGSVVIYDLGLKLMNLIQRPIDIIKTVLLPRFARGRNVRKLNIVLVFTTLISIGMVIILNVFMEEIVLFFLHEEVDLLPVRLFSLVPIFLTPSVMISSGFFIAFGYNRYVFYSILFTTAIYLVSLITIWLTGYINSLYGFIFIALISYIGELIYRIIMYMKLAPQTIHK